MHLCHAFALAGALSLIVHVPAQTTWVVDQAGGAGSNFTEIQPAIDAAQPGDVLLVRSGNYQRFEVNIGISILADPGVAIRQGTFSVTPMYANGIPAGQTLIVDGIDFSIDPISLSVSGFSPHVENNSGQVVISNCTFNRTPALISNTDLWVVDSSFHLVLLQNAEVTMDGCSILTPSTLIAAPAIDVWRSRLALSRCHLAGSPAPFAGPALSIRSSTVWVTGDGTGSITGGLTSSGGGSVAIDGVNGRVFVDPVVPVQGTAALPPFGQGVTVTQLPLASLRAPTLRAGTGSLLADLYGPQGPFVIFISDPATLIARPSLNGLLGIPDSAVPFAIGTNVFGGSMQVGYSGLTIPPSLVGRAIAWQAVVGLQPTLSNPTVSTVLP